MSEELKTTRRRSVSGKSKQHQVYLELKRCLNTGRYEIGSFLPSIRELARSFQSSITPVRLAIDQLERDGLLVSRHGSGVSVISTMGHADVVAKKPVIEVVTTVTDRMGGGRPSVNSHRLMAVQENLLWSLTGREDIRLTLATVRSNYGERLVLSRLQDALAEGPDVLVLPMAEVVNAQTVDILRQLHAQGTKIVYNAAYLWVEEFDRVMSDFRQGQYLLTRTLLDKGFRRILRFSSGNTLFHYEAEKQKGFAQAMTEAGWSPAEIADFTVNKRLGFNAEHHVTELLALLPEVLERTKPEAICSYTDVSTVVLRTALRLFGKQDIEITGYDGNWYEMNWPAELGGLYSVNKEFIENGKPPTSVDAHLPELGIAMAEQAVARALGQLEPGGRLVTVPQTVQN